MQQPTWHLALQLLVWRFHAPCVEYPPWNPLHSFAFYEVVAAMSGLKKRLVVMVARAAAWDQIMMEAMVGCCPR